MQEKNNCVPSTMKVAVSAAASWAWGTSLVVGRNTLLSKGLPTFLIWAVCNCIALPLFSLVFGKVTPMRRVINTRPMVLFMTLIQVFAIWIQMNAIYEIAMQTGFIPDMLSRTLSYATGIGFIVAMYKNGLFRSILTDQFQWMGVILGSVVIIAIGLIGGHFADAQVAMDISGDNLHWGIKSGFILFCGPIMDIQHWQRMEFSQKNGQRNAYLLAGALFAGYLTLVAITAFFDFSPLMHLVLLGTVYCVATSTLDSAAVALHKIGGAKVGVVIGLVAVLSWQFVINVGVLNLWTYMGTARLIVCGLCLLLSAVWMIAKRGWRK